jgi:hypothetical protein
MSTLLKQLLKAKMQKTRKPHGLPTRSLQIYIPYKEGFDYYEKRNYKSSYYKILVIVLLTLVLAGHRIILDTLLQEISL